jgi:hypothetical protein
MVLMKPPLRNAIVSMAEILFNLSFQKAKASPFDLDIMGWEMLCLALGDIVGTYLCTFARPTVLSTFISSQGDSNELTVKLAA